MAEEKDATEQTDGEVQPRKPFLRFIVMGIAVIILGIGGFAGWSLFVEGNEKETPAPETPLQSKDVETRVAFPLESFIVNLMDKSGVGKRYLKVTIVLELNGEEGKKAVQMHTPELKDTILMLLSSQFFDDISTIEGKLELKQALISRINQALGNALVQRIYFTEFVVQ